MVYYTCKVSFTYIMHIWDILKMHIEGKLIKFDWDDKKCLKWPFLVVLGHFEGLLRAL